MPHDGNLPDMSGFEVLHSLRVSRVKTPTLILSGLAGIEDKVKGLGGGADDYMTKPFHKDELVARRQRFLGEIAGTGKFVLPIHFPHPTTMESVSAVNSFARL